MANEIYDSSWWGVALETASSIGTKTEFFSGQFNLTKIGEEEVTNGDFATDSNWNKNSNWTISGGTANCDGTNSNDLNQAQNIGVIGKSYKITFTITAISQGSVAVRIGSGATAYYTSVGTHSEIVTATTTDRIRVILLGSAIASIDNVSVKEVRASSVEAKKCIADWTHITALQDLKQ
jgi:hypothetical protein